MKIRILLVDGHLYVREGLRFCLGRHARFEVVGEASTGQEAIVQVKALKPDVVVMNISLSGMDGLEATRCLRDFFPKVPVLILTDHQRKDLVKDVVQSGARGYLNQSAPPAELIAAIEGVHRDGTFFTPDVAKTFFEEYVQNGGKIAQAGPQPLSQRERQVLGMVVDGLPNRDVAERLHLSVRTVEKHRQRVMRKLGVRKATQMVKFAVARGWVDLNSPV